MLAHTYVQYRLPFGGCSGLVPAFHPWPAEIPPRWHRLKGRSPSKAPGPSKVHAGPGVGQVRHPTPKVGDMLGP